MTVTCKQALMFSSQFLVNCYTSLLQFYRQMCAYVLYVSFYDVGLSYDEDSLSRVGN